MDKQIVGLFPSYEDAEHVVQELVDRQIDTQKISMVAARPDQQLERGSEVTGMQASSGLAGVGLLTAATLLLPGFGMAMVAGPMAAKMEYENDTEDDDEEVAERARSNHLEMLLLRAGLGEPQARGYALQIRTGRPLVVVEVPEEQTELVAETFYRHGGSSLAFRRLGEPTHAHE